MASQLSYGQYCPLAMSAEFLCTRWTLLVLRELLFGSTTFNDISRGVPRMSRSLLSKRLKELETLGIITHTKVSNHESHYRLTEAGLALESVVLSMAGWGQQWLKVEPSLKDIDVGMLMWDIRRNTHPLPELPNPFVVEFNLTDVHANKSQHWLVFKGDEVDLCHIDYGFDVDVCISVTAEKLTEIWMGWGSFDAAVSAGELVLAGDRTYTRKALNWLGQSRVAHIAKQPPTMRI